jgi:transposase
MAKAVGTAEPVGLRRLTRVEQQVLVGKLRDLKLPARIHQRYRIIDAARRAARVPAAARQVGCHVTLAYKWVHRFNASGFASFEVPSNPRGRVPIVTAAQLRELVAVALSSPLERGLPFAVWSVPKLAAYCREHNLIPPFCDEWVRRLLRGAGFTAQRIRTWKTSRDPAFDVKKKRLTRSMRSVLRARPSSASTSGGRWS